MELTIGITLANGPNWAQFEPVLERVDVIQGDVTGPVADRDAFRAAGTRVVRTFQVRESRGRVELRYSLGALEKPVYVRVRGTDGNRYATGFHGAAVDPAGPAVDLDGDADPWQDLWFYSNPIWALPY
ncbi:hypothetical protein GCM10029964_034310 [Kibdelosporangium lantanae]